MKVFSTSFKHSSINVKGNNWFQAWTSLGKFDCRNFGSLRIICWAAIHHCNSDGTFTAFPASYRNTFQQVDWFSSGWLREKFSEVSDKRGPAFPAARAQLFWQQFNTHGNSLPMSVSERLLNQCWNGAATALWRRYSCVSIYNPAGFKATLPPLPSYTFPPFVCLPPPGILSPPPPPFCWLVPTSPTVLGGFRRIVPHVYTSLPKLGALAPSQFRPAGRGFWIFALCHSSIPTFILPTGLCCCVWWKPK